MSGSSRVALVDLRLKVQVQRGTALCLAQQLFRSKSLRAAGWKATGWTCRKCPDVSSRHGQQLMLCLVGLQLKLFSKLHIEYRTRIWSILSEVSSGRLMSCRLSASSVHTTLHICRSVPWKLLPGLDKNRGMKKVNMAFGKDSEKDAVESVGNHGACFTWSTRFSRWPDKPGSSRTTGETVTDLWPARAVWAARDSSASKNEVTGMPTGPTGPTWPTGPTAFWRGAIGAYGRRSRRSCGKDSWAPKTAVSKGTRGTPPKLRTDCGGSNWPSWPSCTYLGSLDSPSRADSQGNSSARPPGLKEKGSGRGLVQGLEVPPILIPGSADGIDPLNLPLNRIPLTLVPHVDGRVDCQWHGWLATLLIGWCQNGYWSEHRRAFQTQGWRIRDAKQS